MSKYYGHEMAEKDETHGSATPDQLKKVADEAVKAAKDWEKMSPKEKSAKLEELEEKIASMQNATKQGGRSNVTRRRRRRRGTRGRRRV